MLLRTLVIKLVSVFDGKGFKEAEEQVEGLGKTAAKTEKQVDKLDDELDEAAKAAKKAGQATDKAGKDFKSAGNKAAVAGKQAGRMSGLMTKAAASIATLGPAIAAAGLAALVAGVGNAVAFVADETARLDAVSKGAQKSGLGVKAFQELDQFAKLSGASITNLDKGLGKLNVELAKIGRGATTGPAVEALKELGIEADEFDGAGPTEQLAIIARAMEKVETDADKSRLAFELLGKDGKELVPLFNAGSEAIDGFSASVGKIFTEEELGKAAAYQDALTGLNKVIADVKGEIAIAAAPVLQKFAETIGASVPPVVELFRSIGQQLGPALRRLSDALAPIVGDSGPALLALLEAYIAPLELMADWLTTVTNRLADLVEVGTEAVGWADDMLGRLENDFPRAFGVAAGAVNAIISPLETARTVVAEIFDFIEASAGQIAGVASTIGGIRSALGLSKGTGSTGGSTFVGQSTTGPAGNAGAGAAAQSVARLRTAEARERARLTAEANENAAAAAVTARTRPKRRRGRGGGSKATAATPDEEPGLLDQLGLTSPGAVLENRPAPQTLTIIIAPVIKMIENMTITVSGVSSEGGPAALADAASQAREAVFVRLADLPALVDAMFRTQAKALQSAAGGGKTLQGAG